MRCVLDSFFDSRFKDNDVAIFFITNSRMRHLAGRYAYERRTTDVLSFRLPPLPPQRPTAHSDSDDNQVSWDVIFNQQLPLSKHEYLFPSLADAQTHSPNQLANIQQPNAELGSVYLAPDYCARVARRRDIDPHHYILLATVHGIAHLAGLDHGTASDYAAMKQAEEHAIQTLQIQPICSYKPSSYLK